MTAQEFFKDWGKVIDFPALGECLNKLGKLNYNIYPKREDTFKAFSLCDYNNLNVVILGEDPYPQKGRATGLAFANGPEYGNYDAWSPSLKVIFNAAISVSKDLPVDVDIFPTLTEWARQGVLLLNSALTVKENEPGSHLLIWKNFITSFLQNLSSVKKDVVYLCLGSTAKEYSKCINSQYIVTCEHPAYYARTEKPMPVVFDCVNELLVTKLNKKPIIWV